MQKVLYLTLCLLAGAAIVVAGCTSSSPGNAGTAVTTTETPSGTGSNGTVVSLAPLALNAGDVPSGFTLTSSREKTSDEVSDMAKEIGWREGYVTEFTKTGNDTANTTTITQTITGYNTTNLAGIISMVKKSEQTYTGYRFSDLPLPATGSETLAYEATVNASAQSKDFITGNPVESAVVTVASQDYQEVIFGKGDLMEVIRISGPGADYATLKNLAETAYAKMP
ncbi:MAG: hypothetical protein LUQ31_10520 [Methanoregula sp.]|nr:hypothetical protein [Methanoregula sp.]